MRSFASDNYAGLHPEIVAAMMAANEDHAKSYGYDDVTSRADELFRHEFGDQVRVFTVHNGTGANVTALQLMLARHEAVMCSRTAHIATDEAGAPQRILGTALMLIDTADGRIQPDDLRTAMAGRRDEHQVIPRVLSISQSTELGTVYSLNELRELTGVAHALGLLVHIDGARLANAAAALGVSLRQACEGADILTFGGTKNGAMNAEAVVVINPDLGRDALHVRKQLMQLASKMRFTSAQWVGLLTDELWHRNATHANAMAHRLREGVSGIPGVELAYPSQANAVFAKLPHEAVAPLLEQFSFYVWEESNDVVRWMASWDTTESDVDALAAAVRTACS